MILPARLAIGLAAVVFAIVLLKLTEISEVMSEPAQYCVSAEDREYVRYLALDAIDQAFKIQVEHLFDIWMKDTADQPKRASNGMQVAISAHIRARNDSLKWNPPKCS